ncbi:MAG: hypothetical protein ACTHZ1_02925 [Sphingobacterium sp.]
MQKLLITSGTSSLAQRVGNILQERFKLFFATSETVPQFLENRFRKIPKGPDPTFAHELLTFCLDHQINLLLPLELSEIQSLSEAKKLFEEYGIQVLCPDREELEELLVLQRPPSGTDLCLVADGVSLIGEPSDAVGTDGLFAVADSGDDAALCVV